jgi:hypothetical protein
MNEQTPEEGLAHGLLYGRHTHNKAGHLHHCYPEPGGEEQEALEATARLVSQYANEAPPDSPKAIILAALSVHLHPRGSSERCLYFKYRDKKRPRDSARYLQIAAHVEKSIRRGIRKR